MPQDEGDSFIVILTAHSIQCRAVDITYCARSDMQGIVFYQAALVM